MKTLATTKMTSKGQVVIPEAVRNRLKLHTGDQFVVVGDNDVVILKNDGQSALSMLRWLTS